MVEKKNVKIIEGAEYKRVGKGLNAGELHKAGMVLIEQGRAADFRVSEITHREGVGSREKLADYPRRGHRKKEYALYIK